jgi:hypothetical protein
MARWLKENKKKLFRDLIVAGGRIYFIGPMFSKAYKMQIESRWSKRTIWLVKDFERIIPKKDIFILVDEAKLQPEAFSEWRYIPFLEKGGHYAGVPKDDNTAIKELERLREAGANFIVFGWPAFWWLDHFAEFHRYLQLRFDCLVTNNRIVVFNLRSKVRNSALKR